MSGDVERGGRTTNKATRALTGMVVLDGLLAAGTAWMVGQTRTRARSTRDPALTITMITQAVLGVIGIVMAVLLVALVAHRRWGD